VSAAKKDNRVHSREASARPTAAEAASPAADARTLSVLVVGTDDWAIEQSAASLTSGGHGVHRCHDPGQAPFPCNALRPGGQCPLDIGVDVVVTSRARPIQTPADTETGVTCALHAKVPLVVSGIWRGGPFTDYAASMVGADGDLSAACTVAAHLQEPAEESEATVIKLPEDNT
jgi:hypothetical protein